MNTGQLAVFVIPQQILKKGQGHLQITDIPLVGCPQGYLELGQMMRICGYVNSLGLIIPPCRTPISLFNMSLMRESHFTRHSALENMLFIMFSKLPSIPLLNNV